ncbi:LOW QUALITY PROTEIN: hypothetical protein ACHAWF_015937 [Thalassiosira exigua]
MGTPSACMYATIYYAIHEILRLLKRYDKYLLDYVRWIDDGFILWNDRGNPLVYYRFCKDVDDFGILRWMRDRGDPLAYYRFCKDVDNFGILRWMVEERSKEVNVLDLTIKINDSNRTRHTLTRSPWTYICTSTILLPTPLEYKRA